jgi:hypothetical protein
LIERDGIFPLTPDRHVRVRRLIELNIKAADAYDACKAALPTEEELDRLRIAMDDLGHFLYEHGLRRR